MEIKLGLGIKFSGGTKAGGDRREQSKEEEIREKFINLI